MSRRLEEDRPLNAHIAPWFGNSHGQEVWPPKKARAVGDRETGERMAQVMNSKVF
jgi:hypothetical protein